MDALPPSGPPETGNPTGTHDLDASAFRATMPNGRVYLSGIQALVHLPMLQQARDASAGHRTAGFISGYRGSPLGNLDQALWKARAALAEHRITFQPGVNEELAATAVWGSQQVNLFPGATCEGVFGMWYGKGPGADRSVDAFKHANAAGTSRLGGVLAVVGDDHGAKSSTLPHQSDHIFSASMIPVLNPATVQEFVDFGLHGWAMSRFSGCWVGMKAIADTVETSAAVDLDPHRLQTKIPMDFVFPEGGVSIRWPDQPLAQELRLQRTKIYAAMAYAQINGLNRMVIDSPKPRFGIITTGKSYLDVRQALDALGVDEALAAEIGLRVLKIGMVWPLDALSVRNFAEGLEEILVVEEKRQVIEYQLKEQLYNWREDVRPRVIGKYDEAGEWEMPKLDWLLPAAGELTPAMIARVIAARIARFHTSARIRERLAFFAAKEAALAQPRSLVQRTPHFCSGCPHNSSTVVPEGSRALAGIGCHYMALWMNPEQTQTFSQMGGEGVAWVGQAPFTETRHVFANLGDGTYAHSGLLAIRQAVSAKVPITYKILFNDAVAMTGGQPLEGALTVPMIVRQVAAEGVERVVVVTDDPERSRIGLPAAIAVHHRRELDAVQRELREVPGVSILVYDQTCAAEKRRRRKRGKMVDPAKRVVINDRVCENCGDCSAKSNCMSVVPVETEFGRKREIDQSSCNKDFSCLEGFCPSFVTVQGGTLRRGQASAGGSAGVDDVLPEPALAVIGASYGILVTGVGGTGVVTIGALLGAAATLEGRGVTTLDMAGLAQKGGPVWSHVRIAASQEDLHASRIAAGEANLVLGCDIVVAVAEESLAKMQAGTTRAVVNSDFSMTSDFVRTFAAQSRRGDASGIRDPLFPTGEMEGQIAAAVGAGAVDFIPGTRLATSLLGDSIATNLFMVGYAYQKGLLPVGGASIIKAIEMNGAAVAMNTRAFQWGRKAALDLAGVEAVATPVRPAISSRTISASLDEIVARRSQELTAHSGARTAARYARLIGEVRAIETARMPGRTGLAEAAARNLYKLMAYKDEYEVARLYTDTGFTDRIKTMFEGDYKLVFNMAPPLLSRRDRVTGEVRKQAYGPWMLSAFRLLGGMRRLRGTPLDPFGYSAERKTDRRLIVEYEALLRDLMGALTPANHETAMALAAIPETIRGYGHVRARHLVQAKRHEAQLLDRFRGSVPAAQTEAARVAVPA